VGVSYSSGRLPAKCSLRVSSWDDGEPFAVRIEGAEPQLGFENGALVPVDSFDHSSLDSFEDVCRQAVKEGKKIADLVARAVQLRVEDERGRVLRQLCAELWSARKPKQALFVLALACGLGESEGWNQAEVARHVGVRKQAINQSVRAAQVRFGLRQTSAMRGAEARKTMARRNFRRAGEGAKASGGRDAGKVGI
jgi:hypothetical protein